MHISKTAKGCAVFYIVDIMTADDLLTIGRYLGHDVFGHDVFMKNLMSILAHLHSPKKFNNT